MSDTTDRPLSERIPAGHATPWVVAAITELERQLAEAMLQRDDARGELAEWKTLQSWGGTPEIINDFIKGQQTRIHAAQNAEEQRDRIAEALRRIKDAEDAPDIDATGEWQTGLHCGVEDRNCQDRYEGADYGHTVGVEKALEWAVNEATEALASIDRKEDELQNTKP